MAAYPEQDARNRIMTITAENSSSTSLTDTRIKSPAVLWAGRAFYALVAICVVWTHVASFPFTVDFYRAVIDADPGLLPPGVLIPILLTFNAILMLAFFATSLLLFWQRSNNWIGLFSAIWTMGFAGAGFTIVDIAPFAPHLVDLEALNRLASSFPFMLVSIVTWGGVGFFIALFPDGRLVPAWSWLLGVFGLGMASVWGFTPIDSPLSPPNWPPALLAGLILSWAGLMLYAQVYRYRRVSTPAQRQQTKLLVYFFAIGILGAIGMQFILVSPLTLAFLRLTLLIAVLGATFQSFIAVGLLVSILRYRLWDVDLVINRSLVYGAVTLVAVGLFFAALLGVQVIFGNQQPLIALGIAGVVSAAIFNPLRRWLGHLVDRRVYGLRYDLSDVRRAGKLPEVARPGLYTGRQVGPYTALGVLGKGGMGEVYKGEGEGQTVALKILPADMAEQKEFRERFTREAQTLSRLSHPNIVRLLEAGVSEELYYIAMEYISGPALNDRIREVGRFTPEQAAGIIRPLADALDYAHGQGLVHRDIKASNVMLRPAGEDFEAVLMDFGIAKIQDAYTRYTASGGAVGTIDYMAPEQISAARLADHRADIYALGVLLYEMLAGERPFKGNPTQIMFAHIQQPPPDLRDTLPDLPRPVTQAVRRAMAKDPEERFQSASEFAEALSPA